MTGFVQIIEIKTSQVDEVRRLVAEMRAENDSGNVLRGTVGEDRDRPGYYVNIVEFESYAAAMENSARPEVRDYAARLAALCDQPPRFYNLHVIDSFTPDNASGVHNGSASARAGIAGTAAGVAGVAASSVATGVAAGMAKARELLQEKRRPGGPDGPSHYDPR